MDHRTRIDIAHQVAEFLRRTHPAIIAIDVHGSTAKGEDREHSDLEMGGLTRGPPDTDYYQTIHRGIVIEASFISVDDAVKEVTDVRQSWGFSVDGWTSYIAVFDPEAWFPRLAAMAANPPREKVIPAARASITSTYEDLCKIRNFAASGESAMVRFMAPHAAYGAACFLALLNRQYFNGLRNLLAKPRDFKTLPPHLWDDFVPLVAVDSNESDLLGHAERLYRECDDLLTNSGMGRPASADLQGALAAGRVSR